MYIRSNFREKFSSISFQRAIEYYRDGRVFFEGIRGDSYIFTAFGSVDNEYEVRIASSKADGAFTARCTCPFDWGGYCKHVGAAILEGLETGIFREEVEDTAHFGKIIDFHSSGNKVLEEKDVFIDLSSQRQKIADPDNDTLQDIIEASERFQRTTRNAYRYQLVFIIKNAMDNYYLNKRIDLLTIIPKLRYIRKDGKPGRFEHFSLPKMSEEVDGSAKLLLAKILEHPEGEIPLGQLIPFIRRNRDLTIFKDVGEKYLETEFREITGIDLSFQIYCIYHKREALFTPVIRLNENGTEKSESIPGKFLYSGKAGFTTYFYTNNSPIIYYTDSTRSGIDQLVMLAGDDTDYSTDEIFTLQSILDPELFTIYPPEGRLRITTILPSVRLYCSSDNRGTLVYPRFVYGISEIGHKEKGSHIIGEKKGQDQIIYRRNGQFEAIALNRLEYIFDTPIYGDSFGIPFPSLPELFQAYGRELQDAGFELYVKETGKPVSRIVKINIIASSGIDWLDLKIMGDGKPIPTEAIDLNSGLVQNKDSYTWIDSEVLARLRSLYKHGKVGKESIKINPLNFPVIEEIDEYIDDSCDEGYARIRAGIARLRKGFNAKGFTKPKGLKAKLRPYQKAGFSWLLFLKEFDFGGILADDMGLGKTLQAISLLAHYVDEGTSGPFLVVAPVSTISNWIHEFQRFFPSLPTKSHIGTDRSATASYLSDNGGVVVTSYHTLQRDISILKEIEWKVLMFDESQALKNPATKSHKVVRELQADQVLALSGTPVENNIQDLWSIMRIINPGLLGSRKDFLRRYRKPLEDGNKETIERLRQLIYPFMLRRTKGQVAKDLPPKEEFSIPVTLSAAEEKFYKGLKETLRSEVESILASEEPFRAGIVILAALSKLRQAAIAPKLVGGPDKSSKLEMVFEKIQEGISEDHKILIFSQYVRVLKILEELLEKEYMTPLQKHSHPKCGIPGIFPES